MSKRYKEKNKEIEYTDVLELDPILEELEGGAPEAESAVEPESISIEDVKRELKEAEEARDKYKKELEEALEAVNKCRSEKDSLEITYEIEKVGMQKEYAELEETYKDVKKKLEELEKADTGADSAEAERLRADLGIANAKITSLQADLCSASSELAKAQKELDALKKKPISDFAVWEKLIDDDEKIVTDQLVEMMKDVTGMMGERLNTILSDRSERFGTARENQDKVGEFSEREKQLAEEEDRIKEKKQQLEKEKKAFEAKMNKEA